MYCGNRNHVTNLNLKLVQSTKKKHQATMMNIYTKFVHGRRKGVDIKEATMNVQ